MADETIEDSMIIYENSDIQNEDDDEKEDLSNHKD